MTTPDDRLRELGRLVKRRREAQGVPMADAAAAAGVTRTTWSNLEKGRPVRGLSYAAIEASLGYPSGSFDAYLTDGIEPVPRQRADDNRPDPEAIIRLVIAAAKDPDIPWESDAIRNVVIDWSEGNLQRLRAAQVPKRDKRAFG